MGNRLIKQVPVFKIPEVNDTLANLHVVNENGEFSVNGTDYSIFRIFKDGTVGINHKTDTWFTIYSGSKVLFRLYDINLTNNTNNAVELACKFGVTDSESNYATASLTVPANTTVKGQEAIFTSDAYANTRDINSFVVQVLHNAAGGVTASFKVELYINGFKYL